MVSQGHAHEHQRDAAGSGQDRQAMQQGAGFGVRDAVTWYALLAVILTTIASWMLGL